MDTVTDTSQYQAELRSAPFLSPAYLAALKAAPPGAAPGAQWNDWAAHRAYTTVAALAEHDDPPPDTAALARRQWGITVTPHGTRPGCHPKPATVRRHSSTRPRRATSTKPGHRQHSRRQQHSTPQCGWTAPPLTATVFVTLTRPRASAPWLVSAITVSS